MSRNIFLFLFCFWIHGNLIANVNQIQDSVTIVFELDEGSGLRWFDLRRDYVFNINNTLVVPDSTVKKIPVNDKGLDKVKSYGPVEEFYTRFQKGNQYVIRFLDANTIIIKPSKESLPAVGAFKFKVENFVKNRFVGVYKDYQQVLTTTDVKEYTPAKFEPDVPGLPQYFVLGTVTDKRDFPQHMSKLCSFKFAFLHGEKISLNYYTFSNQALIQFDGYLEKTMSQSDR